jgi:hypothetical protein
MMLTLSGPQKYVGFVSFFEGEENVFTVAVKLERRLPFFDNEASKLPALLVLANQDCGVVFFHLFEKGYETAPVDVDVEQPLPL